MTHASVMGPNKDLSRASDEMSQVALLPLKSHRVIAGLLTLAVKITVTLSIALGKVATVK